MKDALRPVSRRIRLQRGVRGVALGLLSGLAACLLLVAASFFVPMAWLMPALLGALALCPLVGGLLGLLWPVSRLRAARLADRCGLKERAVTAMALAAEDTPMARLQRADAEAALAALPLRQAMPLRAPRRWWLSALALAVMAAGLLLLPNPQDAVLRARAEEKRERLALADTVEEAAEQLAKEALTPEEQQELRRITRDMAEALREAGDKREALEALDQSQQSLDDLRRQVSERTTQSLSEALGAQPGLEKLSAAMESGDAAEMQQALADLGAAMESEAGLSSLAEGLQQAADALPAGAMQQALLSSANAAAQDDANQAMASLEDALAAGEAGGQSGTNMAALMRMARTGVAQSGSGSGQGSGQSPGKGAGGGAGMGSTNQDMSGAGSTGNTAASGTGTAPGEERVREYERIYDPTRLGGDSEATHVAGQQQEGQQQQMQLGPGQGSFEESVPYTQVVGAYQEAAAQSMRRENLPGALQDFVTRYFDALIDQ